MSKIKILKTKNYLALIKNSLDSRLFSDVFGEVNGKVKNLTKKGELSCAYFVSSILKIFDLIGSLHLTVDGTVSDMKKHGWLEKNIKKITKGDVIIWEDKDQHSHIGFYIGNYKAISNNSKKHSIKEHHYTFSGKRKIITVLTKKI